MEPSAAAALAWLTSRVRDEAFGWGAKRVLDSLSPKIDHLSKGLASLDQHALDADEKKDDELVAPLREGIRWWQLGEVDKGIVKLMEAEGRNPLAPIPRIFLALAHIHRGGAFSDQARVIADWMSGAVRLNPFAFERWLGSDALAAIGLLSQPSPSMAGADWTPWRVDLSSSQFIEYAEKQGRWPSVPLWAQVDPLNRPRSTAAIARASMCGMNVAVQWQLAGSFHRQAENALGVFCLESGQLKWGRLNSGEDLVFLSYNHVIVRWQDRRFSLLGLETGAPEAKMCLRLERKLRLDQLVSLRHERL